MPDLSFLYQWLGALPFDVFQPLFMRRAFLALMLLAPMTAALGVQVVNFRMSFFSDAISHGAFAGVALGLILGIRPRVAMPVFGVLVGLGIMMVQKKSRLSADTVIGVFFSAVVAFGLAVISRENAVAGNVQQFLYGDILTLGEADLLWLILLFAVLLVFQVAAFNSMALVGLNATIARAHGIKVGVFRYLFAALLALVVMFSVWGVGVLLVTALLIVPAAGARNFARTAAGMFWWAMLISLTSAAVGLLLSAQEWMGTATGATIILVACVWFAVSMVLRRT